jgi:hypothetical protein
VRNQGVMLSEAKHLGFWPIPNARSFGFASG